MTTDPEKGRYGSRHPSITDDDGEEFTQQTRAILSRLNDDDRRRIRARMSITSSPPAKVVGTLMMSVAASALFAVAAAAVTMWRNDAVNSERSAQMQRWVQALSVDMREHARSNMHPGTRESLATERERVSALTERVKRIEAQLDAPRRPR